MSLDLTHLYFKTSMTLTGMFNYASGAMLPVDHITYMYGNNTFTESDSVSTGCIRQINILLSHLKDYDEEVDEYFEDFEDIAKMSAYITFPELADYDNEMLATELDLVLDQPDDHHYFEPDDIPDIPLLIINEVVFMTDVDRKCKIKLYSLMIDVLNEFIQQNFNSINNMRLYMLTDVLSGIMNIDISSQENTYA